MVVDYVKWKGYGSLFNRWIDKKDIIIRATGINASDFAKKDDLARFKSKVDIVDLDKLETVPTEYIRFC